MFLPPAVMISSFLRSVMRRKPSASISPTSPECSQPSASSASRGGGVVLEVAPEDVRAAHHHLAVLGELQLGARDRVAGRAEPIARGKRHRRRPAALAHPVDLHDRQAEAQEELERLLRDRRRRDRQQPRAVEPEPRAHLREDEPVGEPVAPGTGPAGLVGVAGTQADRARPGHDSSAQRARLGPLRLDRRLHLLPHARHAEEEVRPHLGEVRGQLLEALGEVDRGARRDREQVRDDLLGDVRERQVADQRVPGADRRPAPGSSRR